MPVKRKLSLTPGRRHPSRTAKKPLSSPPKSPIRGIRQSLSAQKRSRKRSVKQRSSGESPDWFFAEDVEMVDLPALSCPPFSLPDAPSDPTTKNPTIPKTPKRTKTYVITTPPPKSPSKSATRTGSPQNQVLAMQSRTKAETYIHDAYGNLLYDSRIENVPADRSVSAKLSSPQLNSTSIGGSITTSRRSLQGFKHLAEARAKQRSDARESAKFIAQIRANHEKVTGEKITATTSSQPNQPKRQNVDIKINIQGQEPKPKERFIKIHQPGQLSLFNRKLAEHRGELPLTFTPKNIPFLSERDVERANEEYKDCQEEGMLPVTELCLPGYPGITSWNWTGPKVYELVDWSKPRVSENEKRKQVINALKGAKKLWTAKGAKGISPEQVKVADSVLRICELYCDPPAPWQVPYGYAGFLDDGEHDPFQMEWDPNIHGWEYEAKNEEAFWKRWEEEVMNKPARDVEYDWWRSSTLSPAQLGRAEKEGYVPWDGQIWGGWEKESRVIDLGGSGKAVTRSKR